MSAEHTLPWRVDSETKLVRLGHSDLSRQRAFLAPACNITRRISALFISKNRLFSAFSLPNTLSTSPGREETNISVIGHGEAVWKTKDLRRSETSFSLQKRSAAFLSPKAWQNQKKVSIGQAQPQHNLKIFGLHESPPVKGIFFT